MTIDTILFDLDNTLINRRLAFEKYTYDFIDRFVKITDGEDKDEIAKYIISADQDGYRAKRELYEEIMTIFVMQDEITSVDELLNFWFSEFFKCTMLMTGAKEILEHFKSLNIPLGLITNGSIHSQNSKIDYAGIRHYFDVIIVSDEVKVKKPDRRIFNLALEKLKVPAKNAIFIGDHLTNDVTGAKEAGLHAVWLRGFTSNDQHIQENQYAIDELKELVELVERISGKSRDI